HATRRTVVAVGEPVHPAKSLGVRALLLGIRDGVDAFFDRLQHRIVALPEHHFFRVLEEVGHRDPETFRDLWDVTLHGGSALWARYWLARDFARSQAYLCHQASILAQRVPPRFSAYFAELVTTNRRFSTGLSKNSTNQTPSAMPPSAISNMLRSAATFKPRCTAPPAD